MEPITNLLSLVQRFVSLPREKVAEYLCSSVKASNVPVARTLFDNDSAPFTPNGADWTKCRDSFAAAYLSWNVIKLAPSGHVLHDMERTAYAAWASILDKHACTLGWDIFLTYLNDEGLWTSIVKQKEALLSQIQDTMINSDFIIREFLDVDGIGTDGLRLFANFVRLLDDGAGLPAFTAVLEQSRSAVYETGYEAADWRMDLLSSDDLVWHGINGLGVFEDDVRHAMDFNEESILGLSEAEISTIPNGKKYVKPRQKVTRSSLISVPVSGCFRDGTKVYVPPKNNSEEAVSTNIESLSVGDTVISAPNSSAKVISVTGRAVDEDGEAVYGFNDMTPFFTADHVFWTHGGWKAVDPKLAEKTYPGRTIGTLGVGDIVLKVPSGVIGSDNVRAERIANLSSELLTKGSKLTTLQLDDGNLSFYANGYVVGSHQSELSVNEIAKNIREKIPLNKRAEFFERMMNEKNALNSVMGTNMIPNIQYAVQKQDEEQFKRLKGYMEGKLPEIKGRFKTDYLSSLYIPKLTLTVEKGESPFKLPVVSLVYGTLLVDHKRVEHSHVVKNKVFWKRSRDNGEAEFGALTMDESGRFGTGAVFLKGNGKSADKTVEVIAAVTTSEYFKGKINNPSSPDADTPHVMLQIFRSPVISARAIAVVGRCRVTEGSCDPEPDELFRVTTGKISSEGGIISLSFEGLKNIPYLTGYSALDVKLSPDGTILTGTVEDYTTKEILDYTGTLTCITNEDVPIDNDDRQTSQSSKSGISKGKNCCSRLTDSEKRAHEEVLQEQLIAAEKTPLFTLRDTSEVQVMELSAAYELSKKSLSVLGLYNMTPPTIQDSNELGQAKVLRYMMYCMSKEQRDMMQLKKPVLKGSEEVFLDKGDISDFLAHRYANSYIAHGFSQSSNLSGAWGDKLQDAERNLPYYWKGSGKNCLAADAQYTPVQIESAHQTFRDLVDGMEDYMTDSNKAASVWAKEYYEFLTMPSVYFALSALWATGNGGDKLNLLSMQLNILDPKADYAQRLLYGVHNLILVEQLTELSPDVFDDIVEHIPDFVRLLTLKIDSYNPAGGGGSDEKLDKVYKDLQTIINEAMLEQDIDMTKNAMERAQDFSSNIQTFVVLAITSFQVNLKSTKNFSHSMYIVNEEMEKKKYPSKGKKAGAVIVNIATVCGAVGVMYNLANNFDTLTPIQKASAVVDAIATFGGILEASLDTATIFLEKGSRRQKMKASIKYTEAITSVEMIGTGQRTATNMSRSELGNLGDTTTDSETYVRKKLSGEAQWDTKTDNAKWRKKLNRSSEWISKSMDFINSLAAIVGAVTMALRLKADIENGAPGWQIFLTTMTIAANALTAICTIGPLIKPSRATAFGNAGGVFAIIGLVLSVVNLIFGQEPPRADTPQEKWIKKTGKNYIAGIGSPNAQYAIQMSTISPDPLMVSSGKQDSWLARLLMRHAKAVHSSLRSGKFVAEDNENFQIGHIVSVGNKISISLSPIDPSGGSDTEGYFTQYADIVIASDKLLKSARLSGVNMLGYDPGTKSWRSTPPTVSDYWYLYRAKKMDTFRTVTIELNGGSTFKMYSANMASSE